MLKPTLAMLKEYGCTVREVTQRKHHKIRFTTPNGAERCITVSVSASDAQHVAQNIRADIKRILRNENNPQDAC